MRGERLACGAAEIDATAEAVGTQAKVVIAQIAAQGRALAGLDGNAAVGVAHRDGRQNRHRVDGRQGQNAAVIPVGEVGTCCARQRQITTVIRLTTRDADACGQAVQGHVGGVAGAP